MMWQYKREESQFDEVPVGMHRLRINSVEKSISKNSGNDMLVITFDVSGHKSRIWYYISFLCEKPEVTNRMLTALFDSFGIEDGNFNIQSWVGKVGAGFVKHDDEGRAKIGYLIHRKKQDELPAWKEPGRSSDTPAARAFTEVTPDDNEDLPF